MTVSIYGSTHAAVSLCSAALRAVAGLANTDELNLVIITRARYFRSIELDGTPAHGEEVGDMLRGLALMPEGASTPTFTVEAFMRNSLPDIRIKWTQPDDTPPPPPGATR